MSFCWLLGVSKIDTLTIVVLGGGPSEGLLGCLLTARSAARLMSFPGAKATCTFGWAHGGPDGAGNGAGANRGTGGAGCGAGAGPGTATKFCTSQRVFLIASS